MIDFEVKPRGRRCAKTDRAFEPGEAFYSVLVSEGSDVVRYDYAADQWEGPPEQAVGWWKSQIPDQSANKVQWAPNDVMRHYFQQLEENPEKTDVRYILTLLMIRRRLLRLEETETDDNNRQWLVVYCPKQEASFRVPVTQPDAAQVEAIQEELAQLLFATAT